MINETFHSLLTWGTEELEKSGVPEAALDAWYLMEYVFEIKKVDFLIDRNRSLSEEQQSKAETYRSLIEKRGEGYPVQHLMGFTEFMGLRFKVNEHVLIPRQDTEVLVETALSMMPQDAKVLDMCTGSGCIILSLAKLGTTAECVGVDISEQALAVAVENRDSLELKNKVQMLHSDLFENVTGEYDMIVSNPPYIPTAEVETLMREVRDHEPHLALDGSEDGLVFYRQIVRDGRTYLKENGVILFEIGWNQGQDVSDLLKNAGYVDIHVKKDLAGLDRVVYAHKS